MSALDLALMIGIPATFALSVLIMFLRDARGPTPRRAPPVQTWNVTTVRTRTRHATPTPPPPDTSPQPAPPIAPTDDSTALLMAAAVLQDYAPPVHADAPTHVDAHSAPSHSDTSSFDSSSTDCGSFDGGSFDSGGSCGGGFE